MTEDVETLAEKVKNLSEGKLASFRKWFARYDAQAWDQKIESDVEAGQLDDMAEKALSEHEEGKTTKI